MDDYLFFKRHSKRAYLDKEIPPDVIEKLWEIIRWTPSCANNQPWRLVFCRKDADSRKAFNSALARGNEWAAKAPILIALVSKESDDAVREDDPVRYYQFDSGMACLSLLLGAVEHGLMGHPMAGWDAPKVKKALSIPDEYHVLCLIALGYEGPIDLLDDRTRKKDSAERTRKPVGETICYDKFSL